MLTSTIIVFLFVVSFISVSVKAEPYVQIGLVYSDHAPYDAMNVSSAPWKPWRRGLFESNGIFKYDQLVTVMLYNATPTPTEDLVAIFRGKPDDTGNVTLYLPFMHDGTQYRVIVCWNFTAADGRRVDFIVNQTCVLTWCSQIWNRHFSPPINTTYPNAWRIKCQVYNVTFTLRNSYGNLASETSPLGLARVVVLNGTNWNGTRWADGSAPAILYNVTTPPSTDPLAGIVSLLLPNTTDVRDPSINYTLGLRVYWPPDNEMLVYNHTIAANHTRPFTEIPGFVRRAYNITYLSTAHPRRLEGIWLNCSVYKAAFKLTDRFGNTVGSTDKVEVYGRMLNGTKEITAQTPASSAGWLNITYAALCVDEAEGNINTPQYCGEGGIKAVLYVEWKHSDMACWYRIYREEALWSGNLSRHIVVWANKTKIRLYDKQEPPQPLIGATVTITFPQAAATYTVSSDGSGYVDLNSLLGSEMLPVKHEGEDLTYHMTVEWKNVVVLDCDFKPVEFERDTDYVKWDAYCDVFRMVFYALDSHDDPLQGCSYVTITDPTGGQQTYTLHDGTISDRVPGGIYEVVDCSYKGFTIPPLINGTFVMDSNKIVRFRFPVYDVYLYVSKYFNLSSLIEGIEVYAIFPSPWGTQVAGYSSLTSRVKLSQIPNGTLTIYMNASSSTPGFEALASERIIGWDEVEITDSDVNVTVRCFIYDPIVMIWAQPVGLPEPYINYTVLVLKCNTTSPLINLTETLGPNLEVQFDSNQSSRRVLVGGFSYPFRVYIAGILSYNGTLTLPSPPEEVVQVSVTLFNVTVIPYNFLKTFIIPNLNIRVSWPALNTSSVNLADDLEVKNTILSHIGYFTNISADQYTPRHIVLYNLSFEGSEEMTVYMPIWDTDYLYGNKACFEAWTVPGETPGVPSSVDPVMVVWSGWPRRVYNASWYPFDGYNVTGDVTLHLLTSAFDFKCTVYDYRGEPLRGFLVNVSINNVLLDSKLVEDNPLIDFRSTQSLCYWSNYTYTISCNAPDPYGIIRYPMTKYNFLAAGWLYDTWVNLNFEGCIAADLRDTLGRPFGDALVCLVNNTGPATGEITIYAEADENGLAQIPVPAPGGLYDVKVLWLKDGQLRLDMILGFAEDLQSNTHATIMVEVYDAGFTFISDTGRILSDLTVVVYREDMEMYHCEVVTFGNGTILVKQAPIGSYVVKAYWPGTNIIVYEGVESITGLVRRSLKCLVYDISVRLRSETGHPLSAATLLLHLPDGSSVTLTTNDEGFIELINVPIGEIMIDSVEWLGSRIEVEPSSIYVTATHTYEVQALELNRLTIKVVGALGQGLRADIMITPLAGPSLMTSTDESGVIVVEVPSGVYNVTAITFGRSISDLVDVSHDLEVMLKIDVYLVILGNPLGFWEFIVFIGLVIGLILIVSIIIYEYMVRREEMLLKV